MHRLRPNFITDGIRNLMAQQKQGKQLILTNNKNIFTFPTNTTLTTYFYD